MANSRSSIGWLRKRTRLNVVQLMVLVLIAGTGLGLVVRKARVQRDSVRAILRSVAGYNIGDTVYYDWELPDGALPGLYSRHSDPRAPKWLVRFLGVDYFGHVVYVKLPPGVPTADELMAQVGRLTGVRASTSDGPA